MYGQLESLRWTPRGKVSPEERRRLEALHPLTEEDVENRGYNWGAAGNEENSAELPANTGPYAQGEKEGDSEDELEEGGEEGANGDDESSDDDHPVRGPGGHRRSPRDPPPQAAPAAGRPASGAGANRTALALSKLCCKLEVSK